MNATARRAATLQSKGRSRATTSAYQLSGIPGGSEPESTTQRADSARSRIAAVSAASAASSITAPGSLIFVVVPSDSVIVRLVRTAPSTGTA